METRCGTRSSAILRKLEQLVASIAVPHGYDTDTDTRVLYFWNGFVRACVCKKKLSKRNKTGTINE
jgi:hypothetical protein